MRGKLALIIFGILIIAVFSVYMLFSVNKIANVFEGTKDKDYSDYEQFKTNTEAVEGKVKDKYKREIGDNNTYYLALSIKDKDDKLVSVSEEQYKAYNKGAKAKFRIAKTHNNKAIIDLSKQKDADTKEAYQEFQEGDSQKVWIGT